MLGVHLGHLHRFELGHRSIGGRQGDRCAAPLQAGLQGGQLLVDAAALEGGELAFPFLHRLGVRWFMPGEFGEVVPQARSLTVPEIEVRQRPAFRMRNYWQHHRGNMEAEDTEWKIHHKMNPRMQQWFGVPGDSSIREYLPKPDAFKAHPTWKKMKDDPQYADTVSKIANSFLVPTAYSSI